MIPAEKSYPRQGEIREDVSREDIVSAFRTAMIGHFRSHIPGANINESTLLASDYLNHFRKLLSWRPLNYEEHFTESGFRDKNLAIAPYRRALPQDSRPFRRGRDAIAWRGSHARGGGCRQSERQ